MTDKVSPQQRSRIMASIRSKGMRPEVTVRQLAHSLGFRFRLHRRDLPGTPDLVFPRLGKIIFVHGCFWHGHPCSLGRRMIGTNAAYWTKKIDKNQKRDAKAARALRRRGWSVLIVRECQVKKLPALRARILRFLS
jgi:DNA mismatch endonuclease (patch repair protein)